MPDHGTGPTIAASAFVQSDPNMESPEASKPIPSIGVRGGLFRYRNQRVELLTSLGREQRDVVLSELGNLRLVVVSNAELARTLLVDRAADLGKGPALSRFARPVLGEGLLTATGDSHRNQRKLLAPKFRPRHIAGYAETMVEHTARMIARWREREPENFHDEAVDLTIRIAAETMFGGEVGDRIESIGAALDVCNRWIIAEATSLLHLPTWAPTPRNRRLADALEVLDGTVRDMIASHRAAPASSDDVMSVLLDARDEDGNGMDDERIRDEVMTFFMAGHETTANALAWAFQLLARNPAVAASLHDEVDGVLQGLPPTVEDVRRLEYTGRVASEVLRLYPPSYMIGRQALVELEAGDYRIPAGAYIVINSFGMHRRADYFEDPEAFRPERFAADPQPWPRGAYIPFGLGPRVCIGNHFATMELVLILAMLAQHTEFRGCPETIEPDPLITMQPRGGVPFEVAWRRRPEALA
jgi:cytochrome P450